MKILMMVLAALFLPFMSLAGEKDALVTFSTRGPDRYADGTSVKAGEVYALVWVREGQTFAGVDLNGASVDPTNSIVVMAHPLAKEKVVGGETCGYCPPTLFQVPAEFADAHADGAIRVRSGIRLVRRSGSGSMLSSRRRVCPRTPTTGM